MVKYLDNNSGFNQWNAMNANKARQKKPGFLSWILMFLLAWWLVGLLFPQKNTATEPLQPIAIEQSSAAVRKIDSDKISIGVQGLRIANISLKDFHKSSKISEPVSLLDGENNFIEIGFLSGDTQVPNINTKWI